MQKTCATAMRSSLFDISNAPIKTHHRFSHLTSAHALYKGPSSFARRMDFKDLGGEISTPPPILFSPVGSRSWRWTTFLRKAPYYFCKRYNVVSKIWYLQNRKIILMYSFHLFARSHRTPSHYLAVLTSLDETFDTCSCAVGNIPRTGWTRHTEGPWKSKAVTLLNKTNNEIGPFVSNAGEILSDSDNTKYKETPKKTSFYIQNIGCREKAHRRKALRRKSHSKTVRCGYQPTYPHSGKAHKSYKPPQPLRC